MLHLFEKTYSAGQTVGILQHEETKEVRLVFKDEDGKTYVLNLTKQGAKDPEKAKPFLYMEEGKPKIGLGVNSPWGYSTNPTDWENLPHPQEEKEPLPTWYHRLISYIFTRTHALRLAPECRGLHLLENTQEQVIGAINYAQHECFLAAEEYGRLVSFVRGQFERLETELESQKTSQP